MAGPEDSSAEFRTNSTRFLEAYRVADFVRHVKVEACDVGDQAIALSDLLKNLRSNEATRDVGLAPRGQTRKARALAKFTKRCFYSGTDGLRVEG